jgi:radical SAM protein with 4Fe4S-binding SPASM domain
MGTRRVLSLIDEITEQGCLYLLITGGEPFLRKDFHEIYRHAKTNGLLVTVFTNGTLLTDREIGLFERLPPRTVEVSLYGATLPTYEKITGVSGSYAKCISGIRKLLDHKINVTIKTILMTHNSHEFFDIEKMAKELGVKFRFDAAIFPGLNGDRAPLGLRVSPSDAVDMEFSDEARIAQWEKFMESYRDQPITDDLYHCSAGVTGFYIGPYGGLSPCLMTTGISHDLQNDCFLSGWEKIASRIREPKLDVKSSCHKCERITLCGYCPAFFSLENGREDIRSEYICSIGTKRYQRLKNCKNKGVPHAG